MHAASPLTRCTEATRQHDTTLIYKRPAKRRRTADQAAMTAYEAEPFYPAVAGAATALTSAPADSQADADSGVDSDTDAEAEADNTIPPHPLGIRPQGNAYAATPTQNQRSLRRTSAGVFALLPDELLAHLLDTLAAPELLRLGATCRVLYAFCRADDLWRALFVLASPKQFTWRGSWRATLLNLPPQIETRIRCDGLYSDVLYRPFYCAHIPLAKYARSIPAQNGIARVPNLTAAEFAEHWSGKPFILTEPVTQWPIYGNWTTQYLLDQYRDVECRAEAVDWPLKTYVDYMHSNSDESPLYLFDRAFVEKMQLATGKESDAAYWAPECFGKDLFSVFGVSRPDHRWMIMGPARSGSTFHKDPNATSAWNAVLTGSKYWLMFPSGNGIPPPPGVILSEDGSEITSPLSIAEYLLVFHEAARATPGCQEGICYAGEVLHVPSGWFHLVLNLEDGIAITQNFVPENKLVDVMQFLRDTPDQVSGFRDDVQEPFALFVEGIEREHPNLLGPAMEKLERRSKGGRTKWEQLTKATEQDDDQGQNGGFSFGFGSDYESDAD